MKKISCLLLVLLFFVASCKGKSSDFYVESEKKSPSFRFKGCIEPDTFIKIAEKVGPAVVNVNTTKTIKLKGYRPFGFFGGEEGADLFENFLGRGDERSYKQQGLGSGFIISKEGYIVTNNHVVEMADEVDVTLADDSSYKVEVIGKDKTSDIALLKIKPTGNLPSVVLGDSDNLEVGEVVVAIGSPLGFSQSVTQGIVSAKGRTLGPGTYASFIQTDATINSGNDGGPLLNIDGEVVGINTAFMPSEQAQRVGFSIPVNLAKSVIAQLKEKGKVTRAWLGVYIQEITEELARSMKLRDKNGALVSDVVEASPAAKAGIKTGDVIVLFDGTKIKNYNELPLLVSSSPIGKTSKIEVIRDGKNLSFSVVLKELKETEDIAMVEKEKNLLGITVKSLSPDKARELGFEPKGVLVTGVDTDGPAWGKGIEAGDVIIELNKNKIQDINDFNKISSKLKKGDNVLLFLKRKGNVTLFVAFTL